MRKIWEIDFLSPVQITPCFTQSLKKQIILLNIANKNECVKAIQFRRNYGKSAALNTAFAECKGKVVITMDADLQDSPEEIPDLYKMIVEDGFDLVSGWKKKRSTELG